MIHTLSQRGLSVRIGRSVSWIRKQGMSISTNLIRDGLGWKQHHETWTRQEYATGRLAGYRLQTQSEDAA